MSLGYKQSPLGQYCNLQGKQPTIIYIIVGFLNQDYYMTELRHKKGLGNIKLLYGEVGEYGLEKNAKLSNQFDKYICDFAYGDIYSRESLSLQQKQIVTISSLVTQGCVQHELKMHILGGLNAGLTREQVLDICVHCLPYVGFPKVTVALETAHALFDEIDNHDGKQSSSS